MPHMSELNKKVVGAWIDELKKFAEQPTFRKLAFPMLLDSSAGDLLSPEGILCNLHAKETGGKWLPEEAEGKKLRATVTYHGSLNVAPQVVLDWAGIPAAKMSDVRRAYAEGGFESVIKFVQTMIEK